MYNQPYYPNENYSQGYCQNHNKYDKECDNTFYITTTISQTVSSSADGGDGGAGGAAGNVAGGAAAAAAAAGEGNLANAGASTDNSDPSSPGSPEPIIDSAGSSEAEPLQVDGDAASASAQGGDAVGGTAGVGGIGGIGGASAATASAVVTNVVIVNCDGNSSNTALSFGADDNRVDVSVDKDGNTLVNGQKMYEQALDNGSKVFIFRSTEQKTE